MRDGDIEVIICKIWRTVIPEVGCEAIIGM
jgi:hypothetical protein